MNVAGARAELGMYPMRSVRWAWDVLWRAVADRVGWLHGELDHSGDVHAAWVDPDVVVNHVCGWPFAAFHLDTMRLVGAFDVDLGDGAAAAPGTYRSVLVTPHADRDLASLVGARAVINSTDSLSGALSLVAAALGPGQRWLGPLTATGSHAASIDALLSGTADVACIDAWSLALLAGETDARVNSLYEVGRGPTIPTPVVTVRRSVGEPRAQELSVAFAAACADAATESARRALRINGWVEPSVAVYQETLKWGPLSGVASSIRD